MDTRPSTLIDISPNRYGYSVEFTSIQPDTPSVLDSLSRRHVQEFEARQDVRATPSVDYDKSLFRRGTDHDGLACRQREMPGIRVLNSYNFTAAEIRHIAEAGLKSFQIRRLL